MAHERIEPEFLLWELLDVAGRGGRRQLVDRRRGGEVPAEGAVRHAITSGSMGRGKRFRAEWKDRGTHVRDDLRSR